MRGFLDEMGAQDVPTTAPILGDWTADFGYLAGRELLTVRDFTAIFASNDQMALGVMHAVRDAGLEIPRDVSVVGFDDIPEAAHFHAADDRAAGLLRTRPAVRGAAAGRPRSVGAGVPRHAQASSSSGTRSARPRSEPTGRSAGFRHVTVPLTFVGLTNSPSAVANMRLACERSHRLVTSPTSSIPVPRTGRTIDEGVPAVTDATTAEHAAPARSDRGHPVGRFAPVDPSAGVAA